MDRIFTRGIPTNEHLPKTAHKLADKIRNLEAKHREALSAYTQYNPNTREGRSAENAAKDADREALAQAVLDDNPIVPDKHHREFQQERAKARAVVDAHALALQKADKEFAAWLRDHREEVAAHQEERIQSAYNAYAEHAAQLAQLRATYTEAFNARDWTENTKNPHKSPKLVTIDREPRPDYYKISDPNISEAEAAVRAAYETARALGVA